MLTLKVRLILISTISGDLKLRNDPNEKRILKWLEKVSAVDD